jgi:hypothetical protein
VKDEPNFDNVPRLTREQAAILALFTGITCGPFDDVQRLGDELMGYPTFTHQYGNEEFVDDLKNRVREKFLAICYDKEAVK